jgi:hypothetical protein
MLPLRPRTPVLVEGCAGMAAVSWAAFGAVPPVFYQGGKRSYAADVLRHLAIWRPKRVVWVEADPYVAAALAVLADPDARRHAAARYREWAEAEEAQRERWTAWLTDWPDDPTERGVRWLWMRTRTVPFQAPHDCRPSDWLANGRPGGSSWAPTAPADNLDALPAIAAEVVCAPVQAVEPIPGAVLYLDPPYIGTTGYAADAERPDVAAVAEAWRAAGCVVGVSETRGYDEADGRHALRRRGPGGRNLGSTPEVLSLWRPHR